MPQPEWAYSSSADLPQLTDVMMLNVVGERAYACPYREFHLVTATANGATDLGWSTVSGADGLLVDDDRALLIGGFGADYDALTPVVLTSDGPVRAGRQGRIVMPDGLEIGGGRWHCRGTRAYRAIHSVRYTLSLAAAFDALQ